MTHELKTRMIVELINISLGSSEQIVGAQHIVALLQQAVDEMRADETSPSGHQNAFAVII